MSRLRKAIGYVIRTQDYSETSRILKVLTREVGVISLIAKGARRPDSRFGAALELLTLSEFVYYDREGLKTLSQASLLKPHLELKGDYERLTIALRCARVVYRALEEDHPEERVFKLFEELLRALSQRGGREDENLALYELAFTLKLLAQLGWAPQLERCTGCQERPKRAWFSLEQGGLLCERCRSGNPAREVALDGEIVRGMAMALRLPLEKLRRLQLSPEAIAVGEQLMGDFLAHHFRPLATARSHSQPSRRPQRPSK
jgi:DNA repair protein RecO (recombination protein O)